MNDDQFKILQRRLENIEKSQNLIYKDRDILEDISIRLGTVEDKVRYLSERIEKMDKNTKADNKDVIEGLEVVKDSTAEVVKALST